MKILIISNGWGVKTIGGGEYHISRVMSYWSRCNRITLVIPRSGYEIAKKIIPLNIEIHFSSHELGITRLSTSVFFYLKRIIGSIFLKSEKPDVVISASHFLYDVLPAFILSKRFNSKLIIYNHSILQQTRKPSLDFYNILSLLNERLGIFISRSADSIFTVNDDTKKFLLENKFRKEMIFETDNGIDSVETNAENDLDKEYDCCYCGRISKRKGAYDIIKIWSKIVQIIPRSKLVIIGDGPDFENIKRMVEKYNLKNNIILTGFLFGNEKIQKMSSSKIFLFPSYEEGWGIAISEALSLNLAVVCYDLDAYTIFKDGIAKIQTGQVDMMAEKVLILLKNPEEINGLSSRGHGVINSFKTWESIAETQISKIQKVTKKDFVGVPIPPKILVVSNGWGVRTIGGGEYHILNVMSRWRKKADLYLIIPKSGHEISKKIFEHDYKMFYSSNENSVNNLKSNILLYMIRIIRSIFIKNVKQDITIAASHLFYDTFPAYLISKRSRSKFVVYNHSIIKKTRKTRNGLFNVLSFINEKFGLYITRRADLIFTVDEDTKRYLLSHGYDETKIVTTFNGIENNIISTVKCDGIVFDGCFCGRISRTKGVYDIIKIWLEITKILPQSKFILIGNGPEFDDIRDLIKINGLEDNVILKGFVSESEKIKLIKSSKMFLFPSYEEAWGISVSEALSCGLPVVCYDLKAYDIYGNAIVKIELGKVEEMTRVVLRILENSQERMDLIGEGKKVIEKFSDWDKVADQQLQYINDFDL